MREKVCVRESVCVREIARGRGSLCLCVRVTYLFVTNASSSSKNRTHGLACLATRNAFLISASASPEDIKMILICEIEVEGVGCGR